jgi:hypothetical protein
VAAVAPELELVMAMTKVEREAAVAPNMEMAMAEVDWKTAVAPVAAVPPRLSIA